MLKITNNWLLFVTVCLLLFIQGFMLALNDLIIPQLRQQLHLDYFNIILIQFSYFSAYFLAAPPAALIINKVKYKNGLLVALALMVTGATIVIWGITRLHFGTLLIGLFIASSGSVILAVDTNVILANLGAVKTASSRLNLGHAFTSLGTIVTPLFTTIIMLYSLSPPFALIIATSLMMTVVIGWINFNHFNKRMTAVHNINQVTHELTTKPWQQLLFWLGLLTAFAYMGCEAGIASFAINFMHLPNIANFSLYKASQYLAIFWGGLMSGRAIGCYILSRVKSTTVLISCAIMSNVLLCLAILTHGYLAMWALLLLGLFASIIYPTIFALISHNITDFTDKNKASALFLMSGVGGAIIPLIQGRLADSIGLQYSFILLIPCYSIITMYGYLHQGKL